jgi:hypothetical protein
MRSSISCQANYKKRLSNECGNGFLPNDTTAKHNLSIEEYPIKQFDGSPVSIVIRDENLSNIFGADYMIRKATIGKWTATKNYIT